ncbi:MAG: Fe-S-containing protein [Bacillota bacterium]
MKSAGNKKQEFLERKTHYRGPNRVGLVLACLIIGVTVAFLFMGGKGKEQQAERRFEGGNYQLGQTFNYQGQVIPMKDVEYQVEGGQIRLPLDQVLENKIIYSQTSYVMAGGMPKALTAYAAPSGRLAVAMAVCEPCRSLRFHIRGSLLVCDSCGTTWDLNTLVGLSGGCKEYPPEELPYEVKDGIIYISDQLVRSWQPRI